MTAALRLQKELMDLMVSGVEGISAFPNDDNLFEWMASMQGAAGTAYEGLDFKLTLKFGPNYPFEPPVVTFNTPCFHPNVDCHGTINDRPTLITSGAGGKWDGKSRKTEPVDLTKTVTSWKPRFEWEGERLFQNSVMSPDVRWEVPQTKDIVNPAHPKYNAKAHHAKTLKRDGTTWGEIPEKSDCPKELAHSNERFDCQICHTSWATSCSKDGCQRAHAFTPLPTSRKPSSLANCFRARASMRWCPTARAIVSFTRTGVNTTCTSSSSCIGSASKRCRCTASCCVA